MEEGEKRSRGPTIAAVVAILVGIGLLRLAGSGGGMRPEVLSETVDAPTSTTAAPPPSTFLPVPTSPRPSTNPSLVAAAPGTTTGTDGIPVLPWGTDTAALGTTPETTSTSATAPTTEAAAPAPPAPGTTARPRCPSGAPVAEARAWEGWTDGSGAWRVRVTGAVENRTGASVALWPVRISLVRDDGSTWEVDESEWPVPYPSTLAHGAESSWTWEGTSPEGASITGVIASLTAWQWTDAPEGCASAG